MPKRGVRGACATGAVLMRFTTRATPKPHHQGHRPASSVVFYAPAEQVKANKYDARVRILSANLGQDVLNRYDSTKTPFYLDLALPRARKATTARFFC